VPTAFNKRTFAQSGVKDGLLQTLPESVDTNLFRCKPVPAGGEATPEEPQFGLRELDGFVRAAAGTTAFTFLSVFKWEERKNWRTLLDIFWSAFPHATTLVNLEDDTRVDITVRLLIKTQKLSWGTDPDDDLADFFQGKGVDMETVAKRIVIVKEPLKTELMPALYRVADAFVLPTHGEGWGLPIMEAMATGLPTIATGWGGQTEFMSHENSWPLGYNLVGADKGHEWANPDKAELREAMWEVLKRTNASRARAARACQDVRERFAPTAVAAAAEAMLAALAGGGGRGRQHSDA